MIRKIVNNINCQFLFGRTEWGGGVNYRRHYDESKPFFWLRIALFDMISLDNCIKIEKSKKNLLILVQ